MNAIRISRQLDSQVIDLPELAALVGKRVEINVLEEEAQPSACGPKAGCGKGETLWMAPDFNDTPDGFEEYM